MRYRYSYRCPLQLRIIAFLCILSLASLIALDCRIRPVLYRIANTQAKRYAVKIINDAVTASFDSQDFSYDDIATVNKKDGKVSSIEINSDTVNRIASCILDYAELKLGNTVDTAGTVALGSLTGITYLNGLGPKIKIHAHVAEYMNTSFVSKFENAGINQTRSTLYIRVSAIIDIVIPGGHSSEEITSDCLLADTVIVGEIPESYTSVFQTSADDSDMGETVKAYEN